MYENKRTNKVTAWALALACGFGLMGAAFASGNWVVDHRVSRAEADRMAEIARQGSEFPIVVSEAVLRQLNKFVGTDATPRFVRRHLLGNYPQRKVTSAVAAE